MSDLLNMEYINGLPQPLFAEFYGGSRWPVHDIDVETEGERTPAQTYHGERLVNVGGVALVPESRVAELLECA